MTFESGLAFFIAIIIFAITPGPGVFALLARAMTQGAMSCFSMSLGMAISDIIYLVLACFGLAVIAEHWGGVFTVIRIIGALYLIYLGWKMWKDRSHLTSESQTTAKQSEFMSFIQGFLISASNPKVILFYIAFLPTFMDLSALSNNDIAVASLLCLVGLMIGLMAIAFSASWARRYFRSERAMTGLNRVAGSIMMSAGVFIGTRT
ncbi:MAG: LysE family translocator [Gammaproteobacteria bacterium]|jgi:threonine/homoserine/homoserine lactone efflux protein|nr:LysE family translocator [Gammaproteobacteria bacterium]MBT3723446.1 LysE family translocator [Gammaproteobacteria bacterium]MBT4078284.1 LysE family translocator [Gammaproteobacteria bacterium]MBT4196243.1 LysE family translocator [Gammaproteobacteria bacterium]MBT4451950.1 LysE family translocator [Gammaproteobacteria bacterium]